VATCRSGNRLSPLCAVGTYKTMKYIQLELDLPGCQIKPNTRVRILKPHHCAGKTGRVSMRFGGNYIIRLQGKVTGCERNELEIIDSRKGFKKANHTYRQ
jgi:hypothetical protein